jgi:hypothetical protein
MGSGPCRQLVFARQMFFIWEGLLFQKKASPARPQLQKAAKA